MARALTRPKSFLITAPAQLKALASPARQEILDGLASSGPSSIADLARLLGRRPHAFYYHLRALQKVGLVQQTGTRREGKSDAALFAVPAPRMILQYRLGSPAFAADMGRTLRSMLRLTERDFRRALRFEHAIVEGPRRNLLCSRIKARLTKVQVAAVNRLVAELLRQMADVQGQGSGRLHAVTLVLTPLTDTP